MATIKEMLLSYYSGKKLLVPIHSVVTDFVMTEPTGEELVATRRNQLTVTFIVLTTEYLVLWIPI